MTDDFIFAIFLMILSVVIAFAGYVKGKDNWITVAYIIGAIGFAEAVFLFPRLVAGQ